MEIVPDLKTLQARTGKPTPVVLFT